MGIGADHHHTCARRSERATQSCLEVDDTLHLFGNGATYAGARTAGDKAQRSARLPNTDAPLYVNERDVEASLEDRLPRDGQR